MEREELGGPVPGSGAHLGEQLHSKFSCDTGKGSRVPLA